MTAVPSTYPNPRNDDPWDNDAVHWLLAQPGGTAWSRHDLMECLRHQTGRLRKQPELVERAERFADEHGVQYEPTQRGRSTTYRLYRTDPVAPDYPASEAERRDWIRCS